MCVLVRVCIFVCVCVCVCSSVRACTNFAQYLPGEVSSVVGTKGAMWSRPHTLAGFAWWRGQYHQSNETCSVCVCVRTLVCVCVHQCVVCVRVCMYDSFFSFLTHIGLVSQQCGGQHGTMWSHRPTPTLHGWLAWWYGYYRLIMYIYFMMFNPWLNRVNVRSNKSSIALVLWAM